MLCSGIVLGRIAVLIPSPTERIHVGDSWIVRGVIEEGKYGADSGRC